jgi:hypothetical protein
MKYTSAVAAFLLSIAPCAVLAQSSDTATARPSTPLLWRDGYINWRGKFITPKWQVYSSDDGTKFAIDESSLRGHYIAGYIIGGDTFDRKNLLEFNFDCVSLVEVVSNTDLERARVVEEKAKQIACDTPPATP